MVSTPQLSGLTTRLAAPARLLAMRLGRKSRPSAKAAAPEPEASTAALPPVGILAGRLHVPVLETPSEAVVWNDIIGKFALLAKEERWEQVLQALRDADQQRSSAPGGQRLAKFISQGARAELTAALERAASPH